MDAFDLQDQYDSHGQACGALILNALIKHGDLIFPDSYYDANDYAELSRELVFKVDEIRTFFYATMPNPSKDRVNFLLEQLELIGHLRVL